MATQLQSKNNRPLVLLVCLDVRGPTIPKIFPQVFRTKIVHTSATFCDFFEKISRNTFKPCSHIESSTTNPNPIFKITIYFTKYTQHANICSFFSFAETLGNFRKIKNKFLFYYMYNFHNSCFVIFAFLYIF